MSLYALQHRMKLYLAGRSFARRRGGAVTPAHSLIEDPRRVLLVIGGLLGDSVMSEPVIRAARRVWPAAQLTVLGKPHNRDLLGDCPEVDDWIEMEAADPFSFRHRAKTRRLRRTLLERRFDIAINVLGDTFAHMFAKVGIPIRVGISGHALGPCLTHHYEIARAWGPDDRLNALRVLGFEVPSVVPRLHPSQGTIARGAEAVVRLGLGPERPYAVVHPFGSTKEKWWPIDRVVAVADYLKRAYRLETVLAGDMATRAGIPPSLSAFIVDAAGRLTVSELVGAIARAAIVVSTDSGPFHMAGALGRPLVGLFRARRPEYAGIYPKAHVVFGDDPRCLTRCGWDRCASSSSCRQMNALTATAALTAIDAVLTQPC